jgi:hypothetical protein
MYQASTVVEDQGLTEIIRMNWNGMGIWKRLIEVITMQAVEEEIRKNGRLRHVIEK